MPWRKLAKIAAFAVKFSHFALVLVSVFAVPFWRHLRLGFDSGMYLRNISIENTGPLRWVDIDFSFNEQGQPKPLILVGQNGSGKSILLSHIVNAMFDAKGTVYTDSEVDEGKVYKLRSPIYISHGETYSSATLKFDDGFEQSEIQLKTLRAKFEENSHLAPMHPLYRTMTPDENSKYASNFAARTVEVEELIKHFSLLYFPANRFEEPAWLNQQNLKATATYGKNPQMKGVSGRNVIRHAAMSDNQNWLLDVIYDAFALERQIEQRPMADGASGSVFTGYSGPASRIRHQIEVFASQLLQVEGPFQWSVGRRGRRSIGLSGTDNSPAIQNLFSLSTGQIGLLNIFLALVRDYDLSLGELNSLADIRGLVVVDEVDLHLHSDLQHQVLPQLLALFPNVQFILTTHSPLFILGVETTFGAEGYDLVELPSGSRIGPERFAEFDSAYRYLTETKTHATAIDQAVQDSQRPLLFVEGTIDIDYLRRAAELLGRSRVMQQYDIRDANGYGGLDKLYKHFDAPIAKLLNQKVTLLYDCDVEKTKADKPGVKPLVLATLPRRITKGIENLFPEAMIERARAHKSEFVDVTSAYVRTIRGRNVQVPETWAVNADEKRNLADWVLLYGTKNDFAEFGAVLDLLENPFA